MVNESKSGAATQPAGERVSASRTALNTRHPDCHKAADAFWEYWNFHGETHKKGYYESTWGAINRAIRMVGVVEHDYMPDVSDGKSGVEVTVNGMKVHITGENVQDVSRLVNLVYSHAAPISEDTGKGGVLRETFFSIAQVAFDTPPPAATSVSNVGAPTAENYDAMLRALCCDLSVGGYNSDGLIDPATARAKIDDGIAHIVKVERERAVAAIGGNVDALPRYDAIARSNGKSLSVVMKRCKDGKWLLRSDVLAERAARTDTCTNDAECKYPNCTCISGGVFKAPARSAPVAAPACEAVTGKPHHVHSMCSNERRLAGDAYPRTCMKCGLGPCKNSLIILAKSKGQAS
jgi:hypothetical protein